MGLRTNKLDSEIKTEIIRAGVCHIVDITYIYLFFDVVVLAQNL